MASRMSVLFSVLCFFAPSRLRVPNEAGMSRMSCCDLEAPHPWRSGVRPGITCEADVVRTAAARREPCPTDVTVIH